ncbi:hypothetical protein [Desulfonatronum thiodismutans]|uniref:hypothetical protein n=1 Tax=Desulfonatronum thiodismutans TaxID=159290 RepID=UPI0004ABD4BF|nr:hypothetical protein [Desulfonatronum thiodismutans]
MDIESKTYETPKQQKYGNPGSDSAADHLLERGAEALGSAEKAVGDVYDRTTQKVSETYDQAKSYSSDNPGKTVLIALGIGIGLGLLLSASARHSRGGSQYAEPVVHALSDMALKFFR